MFPAARPLSSRWTSLAQGLDREDRYKEAQLGAAQRTRAKKLSGTVYSARHVAPVQRRSTFASFAGLFVYKFARDPTNEPDGSAFDSAFDSFASRS